MEEITVTEHRNQGDWSWIKAEGEIEKHDSWRNKRNGQVYHVHTESAYEPLFAIWTGKDGPELDLEVGDVLTLASRIHGEY